MKGTYLDEQLQDRNPDGNNSTLMFASWSIVKTFLLTFDSPTLHTVTSRALQLLVNAMYATILF